jgi:hypothetical protein
VDLKESDDAEERRFGIAADDAMKSLVVEWLDHWRKCKAEGMTDRCKVFEAWAITKLANLLVMVSWQADGLQRVLSRIGKIKW